MLDRIDRIRQSFITRKAEESDTHDPIERHDPDFLKKEKRNKSKSDWSDHEEDMTDISVQSLIIFLKGLQKDDTDLKKPDENTPVDPKMRQAMEAYGNKNHETPTARYTYLDDEEQNYDEEQVAGLIKELEALLARGIDHITIEPADGFLNSLEKTVEKYLHLS